MKKLLITASAMAVLSASAMPAFAGGDGGADLQSQIDMLKKQIDILQKKADDKSAGGVVGDVKISMKPSPKIESGDGRYSFQPFGRVHLDAAFFDDDAKDHPDNANFRRARIGFKGKVDEDWKYKTELDFAKEAVVFKDVSLTYTGLEAGNVRVGHTKPSLGLNNNTSSNYIQTVERDASSNAFARGELIGIDFSSGGPNWSVRTGIWNEDAGATSTSDDEAWSFDARASYAPVAEKGKVVHLGGAVSYRVPNAGSDSASFSAKPETGIGDSVVSTGTITGVDSVTVYGAELAGVFDSLSVQGEYIMADVEREAAADPSFDGWYVQTSYLLTGESRPYSGKKGGFKRVKPNSPFSLSDGGGSGAWEILARYSNLDLNDSGAGISGGEMDNFTLGVNWYINNNVRLMTNYVMVDTDASAVVADDDPNIFMARAQWDF